MLSNQMIGLKKLTDLSGSGIQKYLNPDVLLDSLEIHDKGSHQY